MHTIRKVLILLLVNWIWYKNVVSDSIGLAWWFRQLKTSLQNVNAGIKWDRIAFRCWKFDGKLQHLLSTLHVKVCNPAYVMKQHCERWGQPIYRLHTECVLDPVALYDIGLTKHKKLSILNINQKYFNQNFHVDGVVNINNPNYKQVPWCQPNQKPHQYSSESFLCKLLFLDVGQSNIFSVTPEHRTHWVVKHETHSKRDLLESLSRLCI